MRFLQPYKVLRWWAYAGNRVVDDYSRQTPATQTKFCLAPCGHTSAKRLRLTFRISMRYHSIQCQRLSNNKLRKSCMAYPGMFEPLTSSRISEPLSILYTQGVV